MQPGKAGGDLPPSPVGIVLCCRNKALEALPRHPVRVKLDAYRTRNRHCQENKGNNHYKYAGAGSESCCLNHAGESGDMELLRMSANIEVITGKTSLLKRMLQ